MTENKKLKILVIDDEMQIRKLLEMALESYGYEAALAENGKEGLMKAATIHPDLAIVDLGLPDMDGKEVVSSLREWTDIPVIVLTAREQEQEKILALDEGADDYITKPFSMGELMARMRVCLRRASHNDDQSTMLVCGGIAMNLMKHSVTVDGRDVKLTPTEYDLLKYMMQHAGSVLTHKQIVKAVWGSENESFQHYPRVYMRQLRRKIEENSAQPRYLLTEVGIGYRLSSGDNNG